MKGDGRGFEMLYVLADTEGFTNDSEIDFGSVVRRDGRRWVGLAIQIPKVRFLTFQVN